MDTFYRNSSDGTSDTTAPVNGVYGITDIMTASYRTDYNTTDQTDLPLTKVSRDTYAAFSNKLSKFGPTSKILPLKYIRALFALIACNKFG